MAFTAPFALGFQGVILPVVALNENTLWRVTVVCVFAPTWAKEPTAYMVLLHCTSWLTVTSVPTRYGVHAAADCDTEGVVAKATAEAEAAIATAAPAIITP